MSKKLQNNRPARCAGQSQYTWINYVIQQLVFNNSINFDILEMGWDIMNHVKAVQQGLNLDNILI